MVETKYDTESGQPMWKDKGADTWNFFKSGLELIGTFVGNQNIDVSAYISKDTTVNNFIIEPIEAIASLSGYVSGSDYSKNTINTSVIPQKVLDGNILKITNAVRIQKNLKVNDSGVAVLHTPNVKYNVYVC